MGNYDDGVGMYRDECGCAYRDPEERRLGQISLTWTRKAVTPELNDFLRSLKPEIRFEADGKRFRLVHGSPRRMNEYLFEDRPLSSFQRLAATSEANGLIFGHTHKPYTKRIDGVLFVNVGSVGKPKDGDPRACYVIVDSTGEVDVEFRRIPYDVATVADPIRRIAARQVRHGPGNRRGRADYVNGGADHRRVTTQVRRQSQLPQPQDAGVRGSYATIVPRRSR